MVYRFRGATWYWGIALIVRNLIASLATLLDPQNPIKQIVTINILFLLYLTIVCFLQPWKSKVLNFLDTVCCCCVVGILNASTVFVVNIEADDSFQQSKDFAVSCAITFFVVAIVLHGFFFFWQLALM